MRARLKILHDNRRARAALFPSWRKRDVFRSWSEIDDDESDKPKSPDILFSPDLKTHFFNAKGRLRYLFLFNQSVFFLLPRGTKVIRDDLPRWIATREWMHFQEECRITFPTNTDNISKNWKILSSNNKNMFSKWTRAKFCTEAPEFGRIYSLIGAESTYRYRLPH